MKKKMAIVGMQKEVTEFMVRYIDIMLHDEVEITTFLVEDLAGCIYEFPVVLLTHQYFLPEVSPHFPEAQIVSGPKFLTGQNLEQLLMLPRGMRVMVLSKPYALAAEIIEALRDYGIDHLEYVPMEDGVDIYDRRYRDIETALSPGMEHLVPDYIKHTIDLGARTIGPDTLVALLQALDLSMQYVNVYMKISMNTMLENARKLSASLEKSELLSQGRKIILNEVDDGILIVDGKNEITHFNRALEQILDTDKHKWYGRSAQELLHLIGLEKQKLIEDSKSGNSTIFNYKGKMATCRRVAYQVYDRNEQNVIYTFKEVSKIVELENQIRRQLHQKGYVAKYTFDDIWGEDPKVLSVKEKARIFAETEQTILIVGESGTGKELFAQAIHQHSQRKKGPFLAVNFAAIPDALVESELFGYEGGAFTGARKEGRPGVFEQAHGGTLFLDEIGDANLNIQVKLLRVLQEREIMRVGGGKMIPVSVRVIAATNKKLWQQVTKGAFRADLFYRLNVLSIELAPLRAHPGDILPILKRRLRQKHNVAVEFTDQMDDTLIHYDWPGNIRELFNVADYIYYSSGGKKRVDIDALPDYFFEDFSNESTSSPSSASACMDMEEMEMAVLQALDAFGERSVGRNRLLRQLQQQCDITEHMLKKTLRSLQEKGHISIGSTRQGSCMTPTGRRRLQSDR